MAEVFGCCKVLKNHLTYNTGPTTHQNIVNNLIFIRANNVKKGNTNNLQCLSI